MVKLILALFMTIVSSLSFAQTLNDNSPWEKKGQNTWELSFSKGGDKAVIHLVKQGDEIYFSLNADCKQPKRKASLTWKMGDEIARGKDCLGDNQTYETEKLEGWINPLPPEVQKQDEVPTKQKKKRVEKTISAKKLMRLV